MHRNRDGKEQYGGLVLDDYQERFVVGTDFLKADTDGDGMTDAYERNWGFNPTDSNDKNVDDDADGLTNGREFYFDACGARPAYLNPFIEVDKYGGSHSDTGGSAHTTIHYGIHWKAQHYAAGCPPGCVVEALPGGNELTEVLQYIDHKAGVV